MTEAEVGVVQGHEPRAVEAGKARKQILTSNLQKERGLLPILYAQPQEL